MSPRRFMAIALYPIVQTALLGVGVIAMAIAPPDPGALHTALHITLASIVLAIPLSWEITALLPTEKERKSFEADRIG